MELAKRNLPSDMAGTLCLAFCFVNLSVSFCLVNLNSAQGKKGTKFRRTNGIRSSSAS